MVTTKIYSSLVIVRPDLCEGTELKEYSICKNESFSFQMAYKITDRSTDNTPFFIKADSELPISIYYENCVPVLHTDISCAGLEPVMPIGMYPDVLIPKQTNPELVTKKFWGKTRYCEVGEDIKLWAYNDSWQSVWITVNEDGAELTAGVHSIKLELYDHFYEKVGESELVLEVLKEELPKQSLIYTNWFHYDCLADYYNVEIFSDRFFEIMRDFVSKAAQNGMNMIITPAFTPPLDTPIGDERMTAQLIGIRVEKGKYIFDFTLLKRFIDICREEGITYFEHSHLFTQWGAEHAPKIVAEVNGEKRKIFGWDTDATGEEYISFLRQYLTELRSFLKSEDLEDKVMFHISDEPGEMNYKNYEKAYNKISDLLTGYMVGDALSDIKFYESGLVKTPIAGTTHIHDFVGKSDNIWCYYTGGHLKNGMSNRLIPMVRERNRALGIKLYYYNIKGFLHWGYNFYYGELSRGMFNPFLNPCGGFFNAGTSYCVYPANDRTAYQSIRQKIFAEGIIDMRALQLLESLSGREVCKEIIEEHFGEPDFFSSPETLDELIAFRKALNDKIKYYSNKKGN